MGETSLRALVADDDVDTARYLVDALRGAGFVVDQVGDGQEAVKSILANPPDVAVVDLMMPKLHGFEVCRLVKSDPKGRRVKLLVLTARAYKPDEDKARELGADDFALKPFNAAEMVARIKRLVSG